MISDSLNLDAKPGEAIKCGSAIVARGKIREIRLAVRQRPNQGRSMGNGFVSGKSDSSLEPTGWRDPHGLILARASGRQRMLKTHWKNS
jgi:hypothetical protein